VLGGGAGGGVLMLRIGALLLHGAQAGEGEVERAQRQACSTSSGSTPVLRCIIAGSGTSSSSSSIGNTRGSASGLQLQQVY
jgi:hypothetical protein